ncbi:MAG: sulfite exporter TauE/SafE family protein [candidate division KSB1 bacterium]
MLPFSLQLTLLFLVGFLAGFVNILAAGGSLLTLPALIFLGLPAATANGTNRIAILIQNLAAIAGFKKLKVFSWRVSVLAALPAIFGAILGANLALDISEVWFKRILGAIMIGVLALMLYDPSKRIRAHTGPMTLTRQVLFGVGFFLVGVFGGFIQAGVGFLIIVLMLLAGFDLVVTNAVKVLVVFIFTLAALAVFILHGQVNYLFGTVLGLGSAFGGWIGTHVAVKKGHDWVRAFVSVVVVLFALQLLVESFW